MGTLKAFLMEKEEPGRACTLPRDNSERQPALTPPHLHQFTRVNTPDDKAETRFCPKKGRGVIPGLAPDWSRAGFPTQLEGNQSEDFVVL